ncbi:hypothetical protein JCM11641_001785 [Rhodosporidiobolus odoratus]
MAYTEDFNLMYPRCRALLGFDRAIRFKHIQPRGRTQIKRFLRLLESNPALRQHVHSLKLRHRYPINRAGVMAFLSSLCSLHHLTVSTGCDPIVEALFSEPFPRHCPPTLRTLTFEIPPGWHTFHPSNFRFVSRLPRVKTLNLTCWENHVGGTALTDDTSIPSFPSITHLSLSGFGNEHGSPVPLITACPSLWSLRLLSYEVVLPYGPIMEAIAPVTSLTSLALEVHEPDNRFLRFPCDPYLPLFPHLTNLHLGPTTFDPATLHAHLLLLPELRTLSFGPEAVINSIRLRPLISGDERLPFLRILRLGIFTATRGWSVETDGGGFLHPAWNTETYLGPGWILPPDRDTTAELDYRAVPKLIGIGAKNGVRVEGCAVEAAKVMEEWREEKRKCKLAFWRLTGQAELLKRYPDGPILRLE